MLTGVNPLAVDCYLATMPTIAAEFETDLQRVGMSLSTYLVGFAFGQLLAAPVSDSRGRRPTVLVGLLLYVIAGLLVFVCNSVEQFLALRALQALGAGAAVVNVGASVRDLYDERNSARMFSMVMMVMLGMPLVAPAIGVLLMTLFSWQAVFLFLAAYGVAVAALTWYFFPETVAVRTAIGPSRLVGDLARGVVTILKRPSALLLTLSGSLASSCLFVFLTDAAFIYLDYYHIPAKIFPVYFGMNIIALAGFHLLNIRLLKTWSPRKVLPLGYGLMVTASLLSWLYIGQGDPHLFGVILAIMLILGSQALVVGNTMATYLAHFQSNTGIAAAIGTSLQFIVGAAVGFALSYFHEGTPFTLATTLATCTVASAILGTLGLRLLARTGSRQIS
jgi:DHA1 family bicyclomycin/chloramphenicol resistance-like MFS transporter